VTVARIAELDRVELIIDIEAQRSPGKRGVIGEPNAVGGQETARTSAQVTRLVPQPVLERGDSCLVTVRLASELT
jgi:hypothetical protein